MYTVASAASDTETTQLFSLSQCSLVKGMENEFMVLWPVITLKSQKRGHQTTLLIPSCVPIIFHD